MLTRSSGITGKCSRLVRTSCCVFLLSPVLAFAMPCAQLVKANYPHVEVSTAELVLGGILQVPGEKEIDQLPEFCRVVAVLRPSSDSEIRVELWMPSPWNGRLEGSGSGGFAGKISHEALASGVRQGFATVTTDMGMAVPDHLDASVFVNRPERWADWGYRATHEMTVLAKEIVNDYYGANARKAYFVGCSTGGEQGLMEAQRFPDDYDGIVAGAAANNRTGVHLSILWNFAVMEASAESIVPEKQLSVLEKAVTRSCDSLDGVKDGLIADPTKCHFNPEELRCNSGGSDGCLTAAQVDTVEKIYQGPINPLTHASLYPGVSPGSEFGWDHFVDRSRTEFHPPYDPIFKWVFGPDWDWRTFRFDQDAVTFKQKLSPILDATNPDLSKFRAHGGKLLVYHGWSDWLVAPQEAINYFDAVSAQGRNQRAPDPTVGNVQDFYRLFMVPGMAHCVGGPGPDHFDPTSAVVRWVEEGIAPDYLIAAARKTAEAGRPDKDAQSLLCPYPQYARYRGKGNPNDASSYACIAPRSGK